MRRVIRRLPHLRAPSEHACQRNLQDGVPLGVHLEDSWPGDSLAMRRKRLGTLIPEMPQIPITDACDLTGIEYLKPDAPNKDLVDLLSPRSPEPLETLGLSFLLGLVPAPALKLLHLPAETSTPKFLAQVFGLPANKPMEETNLSLSLSEEVTRATFSKETSEPILQVMLYSRSLAASGRCLTTVLRATASNLEILHKNIKLNTKVLGDIALEVYKAYEF